MQAYSHDTHIAPCAGWWRPKVTLLQFGRKTVNDSACSASCTAMSALSIRLQCLIDKAIRHCQPSLLNCGAILSVWPVGWLYFSLSSTLFHFLLVKVSIWFNGVLVRSWPLIVVHHFCVHNKGRQERLCLNCVPWMKHCIFGGRSFVPYLIVTISKQVLTLLPSDVFR